jgi:hypothetical protein
LRLPRDTQLGYEWSSAYSLEKGFPRTKDSAAMVVGELRRIQGNQAVLEPRAIVAAARPTDAPLHPAFTWNDAAAAERWREVQAQNLQRGVRVVVIRRDAAGREERSQPLPVYASIQPADEARGYRETLATLQEPDHREALMRAALRELRLFRARYKALVELAEVMDRIERVLATEGRKRVPAET